MRRYPVVAMVIALAASPAPAAYVPALVPGVEPSAATPVRFAADVALLDVCGGGRVYYEYYPSLRSGLAWDIRAQLLRLEVGAQFTKQLGVTAGAMLAQMDIYEFSLVPITARLY